MGDRGQVKIGEVYLYSHCGATDLIADVKKALMKKWRWDDHEYLTRIIFDVMTEVAVDKETGFGIGSSEHGDIWRLIEITTDNKVIVKDDGEEVFNDTFEKFVEEELIEGEI